MRGDLVPLSHFVQIGQAVEQAIADHEQRLHVPAPERGPLRAIPFAHYAVSDCQAARAVELLETGSTIYEAADCVGAPVSALERKLAEFRPRWRRFLHERETAV